MGTTQKNVIRNNKQPNNNGFKSNKFPKKQPKDYWTKPAQKPTKLELDKENEGANEE